MLSSSSPLRIGILGGTGAIASAEFHRRLTLAWAREFAPAADEAYPEIIHLSCALPGLTPAGLISAEDALGRARRAFRAFEALGTHFVAIPCNSALELGVALETEFGIPTLTPWAAAPAVPIRQLTGVLCSSSLRRHLDGAPGLVFPDEAGQAAVQRCIEAVIAGRLEGVTRLQSVIDALLEAGAGEVRLACTELSCLPVRRSRAVLDTLDCLVEASARRAGRFAALPSFGNNPPHNFLSC